MCNFLLFAFLEFVQHGTVEEIENENKLNVKNIVEEIKNAER